MEMDSDREDAEFRDRLRLIPYGALNATGTAINVSTPGNIESALRNPIAGWAAEDEMFPIGNPRMPSNTPLMSCAFEDTFSLRTSVSGPNGPAAVAFGAYEESRFLLRDSRTHGN